MDIIPGDIVRLKSGGPNMMVERVIASGAICLWFDEGRRRRNRFILETIEKVEI